MHTTYIFNKGEKDVIHIGLRQKDTWLGSSKIFEMLSECGNMRIRVPKIYTLEKRRHYECRCWAVIIYISALYLLKKNDGSLFFLFLVKCIYISYSEIYCAKRPLPYSGTVQTVGIFFPIVLALSKWLHMSEVKPRRRIIPRTHWREVTWKDRFAQEYRGRCWI